MSEKYCQLCPHELRLHNELGVRCAVCDDHHQFLYLIPPPAPTEFCTADEAQAALKETSDA